MRVVVSPGKVAGRITAPASKSYGQRAVAAAIITPGETLIQGLGDSADEQAALLVARAAGCMLEPTAVSLRIISKGMRTAKGTFDCGESGLSARLFLPIAALSEHPIMVTGSGTLLQRPMDHILKLLPELRVGVIATSNLLPATVQGPLQPKDMQIDGSLSSQFLSGLLFAFAAAAMEPATIEAVHLKSYGYAQMSVAVLRDFGYDVSEQEGRIFSIRPAGDPGSRSYQVPGDFSSAAGLMLAGALAGRVTIENLSLPSLQPDAAFVELLRAAGAVVTIANNSVTVEKGSLLSSFDFDATHAPDLFPVLAILASQCVGSSRIQGLHRLIHKESNRAQSISALLLAFGVRHQLLEDTLVVHGPCNLRSTTVASFQDHRIVMAAAVGALVADGPVAILDAVAVRKSYPLFFEDLKKLGVAVTITSESAAT